MFVNAVRDADIKITGQRVTGSARILWVCGSVGTGVFSTVPSILLLYFFTETLHLPVLLATATIFLPKAMSVVIDPMIGRWSDRSAAYGRRPFLVAGGVSSGMTLALLFSVPVMAAPLLTAGLAGLAYLAAVVAFGLFSVPYIAMPAEMVADPAARLRLIGLRMTFLALGIILGGAGGPALVAAGGGGPAGYRTMGVALGAAVGVAMLAAAAARVPRLVRQSDRSASPREGGAPLPRSFWHLLGLYFLAQLATGAGSATLPYLVIGVLGQSEGILGLLLLVMLGSGALASLPWAWAADRTGRGRALQVALGMGVAGMVVLSLATLDKAIGVPFLSALVLIGTGSAGVQVLAFTRLSDVIADADRISAGSRGGGLTGLMTAVEKIALAAGPVLAGGIFWISGGGRSGAVPTDLGTMLVAGALAPALLLIGATILARRDVGQGRT